MNPKNDSNEKDRNESIDNPAGAIELEDHELDDVAGGASAASCCPSTKMVDGCWLK